jgi:hypothetical protein
VPVQLGRRQREEPDPEAEAFYSRLLAALRHPVFHEGQWLVLEALEAWAGNGSYGGFVAQRWMLRDEYRLIVANLSADRGQCYIRLSEPEMAGGQWVLVDLVGDARYVREGDDLVSRGLYLDMPGHGYHLFSLRRT